MDQYSFSIFPNEKFVNLTIYQYGWERCAPLHSFGPAVRNHYPFHLVLSGQGVLRSNGADGVDRDYQLGPGSGFLICPGQVNMYWADERDPWTYAWVEVDGIQAQKRFEMAGLDRAHPIYTPRNRSLNQEVADEITYIAHHTDRSAMHLLGHLYLFLDALTQASAARRKERSQSQRDFYVQEAITFISQNYQRDITVEQIAEACNLNRTYFGRMFKKALGHTPQEYLTRFRLARAVDLMRSTDYPISRIAQMVGYPNPLHFTKVFKKEFGVSPRAWRSADPQVCKSPHACASKDAYSVCEEISSPASRTD